jgi:hypothetical protein
VPPTQPAARWPYFPGQPSLLAAAVAIFLGSALPWAFVFGQFLWGSAAALTWTLSAGLLVLAAAMVRWRLLALLSAGGGGAIAGFFALWQTGRILTRCLSLDCVPGPGLGLLLGGGLLALYHAARFAFTARRCPTARARNRSS